MTSTQELESVSIVLWAILEAVEARLTILYCFEASAFTLHLDF